MDQKNKSDNHPPELYSVSLFYNFIHYLMQKESWSKPEIEAIFDDLGSDISILSQKDVFVSQDFANRFFAYISARVDDPDLAYKVGLHSAESATRGVAFALSLELFDIKKIVNKFRSTSKQLTLAHDFVVEDQTNESCRIIVKMSSDYREEPYQCANRIGIMEGLLKSSGVAKLKIEHDYCMHKGDIACRYDLTWRDNKRTLPFFLFAEIILAGVIGRWLGLDLMQISLLCISLVMLSFSFRHLKAYRNISSLLSTHRSTIQEMANTIDRRKKEAEMIRRLARDAIFSKQIDEITGSLARNLKNVMGYDRCVVLLVDETKGCLAVRSVEGFDGAIAEEFEQLEFNLKGSPNSGLFTSVVHSKTPLFFRDVEKYKDKVSKRSLALLERLGTESLVSVPVLYEDRCLGVIAIEERQKGRSFTSADMELLVRLAEHFALSLVNLENSLSLKKQIEKIEHSEKYLQNLKSVYALFVPAELQGLESVEHVSSLVTSKELSVMFIDIVGFTTFSENRDDYQVVKMLNDFYEWITEIITSHSGNVNKFLGDGILCYFEDASLAFQAGSSILRNLSKKREEMQKRHAFDLHVRIGLHRGMCIVGNIGSGKRLDYTIISDTVNTASRLEQYGKQVGVDCMCVSDTIISFIGEETVRPVGTFQLKGKLTPTKVYSFEVNVRNAA